MTQWIFENAYWYNDGRIFSVTLQHIVTDGVCVETFVRVTTFLVDSDTFRQR